VECLPNPLPFRLIEQSGVGVAAQRFTHEDGHSRFHHHVVTL
jgi:hypothetical protein